MAAARRIPLLVDAGTVRWMRLRLLRWYRAQARPWPWRGTRSPYRIWVAEVMLQQTRVEVVAPAYVRFLDRFPSLAALAQATGDEVLAAWSGLGYYARARHLHQAAQRLQALGYADFPPENAIARTLPGVGPYTAAAVLSIAYGQPFAAVDANVRRVLQRFFGRQPDAVLEEVAQALLPRTGPGVWNQALMELGQRVCLPRRPHCCECPLEPRCGSRGPATAAPGVRPRSRPRTTSLRLRATLVVDPRNWLLVERGAFPYLPHLWLPLLDNEDNAPFSATLPRNQKWLVAGEFRHAILRWQLHVRVVVERAPARQARELAAAAPAGATRLLVPPAGIARLARSSLLDKAWQLWLEARNHHAAGGFRDAATTPRHARKE